MPPTEPPAGTLTEAERLDIELLRDQRGRMRAMPYKSTHLFFVSIHVWAVGAIALLVLGSTAEWAAAALLLAAGGEVLSQGFVEQSPPGGLIGLVVQAQVAWTAAVAAYLAWYFLARRDEDRLMRVLAASYRVAAPTSATGADSQSCPRPESEPGPSSPSLTVGTGPTAPSET